jgi:predicted nucleotidyltransferase
MDFEQKKRRIKGNEENYHIENLRVVREFSKKLIEEMKSLVKGIVLFGSNTKETLDKDSDIDLMIVLDNVSVFVTDELREAYRVIVNNLVNSSKKLHVMTVNFSDLWDMARKSDPVLVNILRSGVPIYDTNLVEPLQYLLEIGRIKPSLETVNNYMARSQTLLEDTQKHLEDALMDLYYSVVDMVHATLMLEGEMPPSPKEMPEVFRRVFKKKKLEKHYKSIAEVYRVSKNLERKNLKKVDGSFYDEFKAKCELLILDLEKHNKELIKEKDIFFN